MTSSPSQPVIRVWPITALVVATMLASIIGLLPAWPGLIHAVALPPLGLIHDLSALLAFSSSWPAFLLGTALSLSLRAFLLTAMIGAADRRQYLRALRFYAVALPFAFLGAVFVYAAGAVVFYALFWFGVIVALAMVMFLSSVPWQHSPRLRTAFRQASRKGFRAGTTSAYLLLLALVGVVADVAGPVGAVAMVPASAVLTWITIRSLRQDFGGKVVRRALGALTAAGLIALVLVVALGPAGPPTAAAPDVTREGSIMLMSGVDSRSGSGAILEIDPHAMGWTCQRTFYFSYAGPGDGQPSRLAHCTITHGAPYERADTLRSREELIPFLEAQTAAMIAPGVLATHSQGVWLSWAAAADGRLRNVEVLVLIGPFPRNPIGYPPSGVDEPGAVGKALIGLVTSVPRPGGTTVFEPDSPLGREWLADPDAISDTLTRPLPEAMRAVSVPSAFDLPLTAGERIDGAEEACPIPVIHPNLPYSEEFHEVVVDSFEGRPLPACPAWRTAIGPLFRHFTAPPSRP